jgi:hypothetical protein
MVERLLPERVQFIQGLSCSDRQGEGYLLQQVLIKYVYHTVPHEYMTDWRED